MEPSREAAAAVLAEAHVAGGTVARWRGREVAAPGRVVKVGVHWARELRGREALRVTPPCSPWRDGVVRTEDKSRLWTWRSTLPTTGRPGAEVIDKVKGQCPWNKEAKA